MSEGAGKGDKARPGDEKKRRDGYVRAFGARCWHVNCSQRRNCQLIDEPQYCTTLNKESAS